MATVDNKPKPTKKTKKAAIDVEAELKQQVVENFELARLRNNFYRDSYRRLIVVLLLFIILILVAVVMIYQMYTTRPEPRYFATNTLGRIVPLVPLNVPGNSKEEILEWAQRAVSSAFTFNYVQFRHQLESSKNTYFTEKGGDDYINALKNSNDLVSVTQGKLIVTASPTAIPTILKQGVVYSGRAQGRYAWDIKIPVQVTYQNLTIKRNLDLEVSMRIIRSDRFIDKSIEAKYLDGSKGIGIDYFNAASPTAAAGV